MTIDTPQGNRNLAVELAGTIAATMFGAIAGLLVPVKGEAAMANAIVGALIAWLLWTRRRDNLGLTLAMAMGIAVVVWPIAFVLLDWVHRYY
jgi:hypothetical protein